MPLSRRVARLNQVVTNRTIGRFADRMPGFGVVHHVGRTSGRPYHTPINCFPDGDDYVIVLTYGAEADWVKNVLAAGGCEIVTRGKRLRLANPHIYTDKRRPWAPLIVHLVLGWTDISENMRLSRTA